MDPQDVLDLLSEYQTLMVDAIFQHKGTVDKFIGDAVMAELWYGRMGMMLRTRLIAAC